MIPESWNLAAVHYSKHDLQKLNKPVMHFAQQQALPAEIQLVFQHSMLSVENKEY